MADTYYVFKGFQLISLSKGMEKSEVKKLLGKDYFIETCSFPHNEKWVYRFLPNNEIYKILFSNNYLVWAAKTTEENKSTTNKKRK